MLSGSIARTQEHTQPWTQHTPLNRKNLWKWKKEELRSNHFFTVLLVLQMWITHLKCKNENESHTGMIRFDPGLNSGLIMLTPRYREEYCVTERSLILWNLSTEWIWGIYREEKHLENTLDTSEGCTDVNVMQSATQLPNTCGFQRTLWENKSPWQLTTQRTKKGI